VADESIVVIDTEGVLRAFDAETGVEQWVIKRETVAETVGDKDDKTETTAEREWTSPSSNQFSISAINKVEGTICGIAELGTARLRLN
jgi:glucose dehydrogenase